MYMCGGGCGGSGGGGGVSVRVCVFLNISIHHAQSV